MSSLTNIEKLQIGNIELIAKQIVEGFIIGLHRSPYHGFSVEFAQHRMYNDGESTKHIDWKLFARTEKRYVKQFEEETNLRCQLVIDTSSSMLFPQKQKNNKLLYAIYSAAALLHLLRKQRDAVGLTFFSNTLELHTNAKLTMSHSKLLFAHLEKLIGNSRKNYAKQTNTPDLIHEIAEILHKRSLIILFTDMLNNTNINELYNALSHLKHRKHEVIIFHIREEKHEINFDFKNHPYKFTDLETNKTLSLNPNEIRTPYQQKIKEYLKKIKLKCGEHKIDFVEVDINKDFKQVLLQYLLKRTKLF